MTGGRLLRGVRVKVALVNLELPINRATEFVVRNHPANRVLHDQLRMPGAAGADVFGFVAADEAGKAHVTLLLFLFAGEADLLRVDHDDEVAGVDVGGVDRFLFAAEEIGGFDRDADRGPGPWRQ